MKATACDLHNFTLIKYQKVVPQHDSLHMFMNIFSHNLANAAFNLYADDTVIYWSLPSLTQTFNLLPTDVVQLTLSIHLISILSQIAKNLHLTSLAMQLNLKRLYHKYLLIIVSLNLKLHCKQTLLPS